MIVGAVNLKINKYNSLTYVSKLLGPLFFGLGIECSKGTNGPKIKLILYSVNLFRS